MKVSIPQFLWGQLTATVPAVVEKYLEGQTVVVTGANVGLGFETAKHFARMNPGKIIIACRDPQRGDVALQKIKQDTGYDNVELWLLDLADFGSVKSFAQRFEEQEKRLDILVENAGMLPGCKAETTGDGWESTLQVNNLSTSLLALLLLPRMIATAKTHNTTPRLVIVASEVHYWTKIEPVVTDSPNPLQFFGKDKDYIAKKLTIRYHDTKLLNVFFTRALNERLRGESVIVNCVNPGYCHSNLSRNMPSIVILLDNLSKWIFARTAEQGSRSLVWAAIGGDEDKDKLRGAYISLGKISEASDYVLSEEGKRVQDVLWDDLIKELTAVEPNVRQIILENLKD